MAAYYNEIDPFAAAWLRELIRTGQIADGTVDDRSITAVQPDDLRGFTQCHFFAGIGGWSYALRLAGWPDDRPVWTGSCPCQPFSSAGKGGGVDDPRHLWPHWHRLIRECHPPVVFGEQVEAAIAHGWLDLVCDDLEREGYAVGAAGLPAASVGAFHIRQRLWFVGELAVADGWHESQERAGDEPGGELPSGRRAAQRAWTGAAGGTDAGELADAKNTERGCRIPGNHRTETGDDRCGCWDPNAFHRVNGMLPGEVCANAGKLADARGERCDGQRLRLQSGEPRHADAEAGRGGEVGGLADAQCQRGRSRQPWREDADDAGDAGEAGNMADTLSTGWSERRPSAGDRPSARCGGASFWDACDWLPCADGKARPVEPATLGMADGLSDDLGLVRLASYPDRSHEERLIYAPLIQKSKARVGRLRGYGNAIVPQVAAAFIDAYLAVRSTRGPDGVA